MPVHTADALILRTYPLGESDRIVVFLTRDRGKKRGVAKNARQSRRRFGGALEPMTCGRVTYRERERRDLVFLQDVATIRSPLAAVDGDALGYVSYFAELIDEWALDNDPNETLYRLGASVVDAIADAVPVERLARYFEFWLLRLQGCISRIRGRRSRRWRFLKPRGRAVRLRSADVRAGSRMLRELEQEHRRQIADAPREGLEVGARTARHQAELTRRA